MTKFLLTLMCLRIACVGYSQTDTVCLPVDQVTRSIRTADSLRVMKIHLDTTTKLVQVLVARVAGKDSTIQDLQAASTNSKAIEQALRGEVTNLTQQRDLQKLDTVQFQNLLRRQKRKTGLMSLLGIATVAGTILLIK